MPQPAHHKKVLSPILSPVGDSGFHYKSPFKPLPAVVEKPLPEISPDAPGRGASLHGEVAELKVEVNRISARCSSQPDCLAHTVRKRGAEDGRVGKWLSGWVIQEGETVKRDGITCFHVGCVLTAGWCKYVFPSCFSFLASLLLPLLSSSLLF